MVGCSSDSSRKVFACVSLTIRFCHIFSIVQRESCTISIRGKGLRL